MAKIYNRILGLVRKNPQVSSLAIFVIGVLVFSGAAVNQVFLGNQKRPKDEVAEEIESKSEVYGVNIEKELTVTSSVLISSTNTPKPTEKATSTPTPKPTSQPEVKSDNATNQPEDHEPPVTYITITPITPTPTQSSQDPTPEEKQYTCEITAENTNGTAPLTVQFYYTLIGDGKSNHWVTAVQWDFDGDGSWDTDMVYTYENTRPTHIYNIGTHTAKMHLKLDNDYVTEICSKEIKAI